MIDIVAPNNIAESEENLNSINPPLIVGILSENKENLNIFICKFMYYISKEPFFLGGLMILTEQMNSYKNIFDAIHNGVVIINREGMITYCNRASLSLLKTDSPNPVGRHINDFVEEPLEMVFLNGVTCSNVWLKIGNSQILINQAPIFREDKIVGAINIFQNGNELLSLFHHLEDKNKEVNKFKEVLELLYHGVIMVDIDGIITMMNEAYCEFLGVAMEEVIGKHVTEVIPNTKMHLIAKTGQSDYGKLMKINNREIIVMRHPIREDGKIVGAIGKIMFTDMNDLISLTQRLSKVESKINFYEKELKRARGAKYSFQEIVGDNEKMNEAKQLALKVADSRSTVLIRGESGTGKELFVHAIHEASDRSQGPLIRINCAAIPANILESELFGYEEGTFTGGKKGGRAGKIEQANGGTLFLDEIGDMPLHMQVKLLRVIQEKEVERLGSTEIKQVDIRLIAATHRPLEDMVKKGEFREDLYYRLNVFHIYIPPLRERGLDIISTAYYLLNKLCTDFGKTIKGFEPGVEELFYQYPWPGNVREMENVIERAIHLVENGKKIELKHLSTYLLQTVKGDGEVTSFLLEDEIEKAEIATIKRALKAAAGHKVKAAKLLGIHRASLYRKLEKYHLLEYAND